MGTTQKRVLRGEVEHGRRSEARHRIRQLIEKNSLLTLVRLRKRHLAPDQTHDNSPTLPLCLCEPRIEMAWLMIASSVPRQHAGAFDLQAVCSSLPAITAFRWTSADACSGVDIGGLGYEEPNIIWQQGAAGGGTERIMG